MQAISPRQYERLKHRPEGRLRLELRLPRTVNVQENIAMVKSGLIDLLPKSAAAGDVSRRRRVATNLAAQPRYQKTHSTTAADASSPSNGGAKIIRLEPRTVASWEKPTLPIRDDDGEYNVIRFPSTKHRNAVDYNPQMLENALAAAVLIVLVISGQWIFSTLLATVP
jgi:hypothetical protein